MSEQQQIIIIPLAYTVIDPPIKGHPLAALCKSNVARCNMDVSDGEAPLPPHLQGYPAEYLPRISTRRMRIFKYDTKKYPFRDVVVEMFQQANIEGKILWG